MRIGCRLLVVLAAVLPMLVHGATPTAQEPVSVQVDNARYDTPEAHAALRAAVYSVNLEFSEVRWEALRGLKPCLLFARDAPKTPLSTRQIADRLAKAGADPVQIPQAEAVAAAERGLCDLVRIGFPVQEADSRRPGQTLWQALPLERLPELQIPDRQVAEPPVEEPPVEEPSIKEPRPELPIGAAPALTLEVARDGRFERVASGREVEVAGPSQRLRIAVKADAPLVEVEITGPFAPIRLDRAELGGRQSVRHEVTVPAPAPGETALVVARALDAARRTGAARLVLRGVSVRGPQILVRDPDGRRLSNGGQVEVTGETFTFGFAVQAEGFLRSLVINGIPEPGSPFRTREVQRRESTLEIPAPAPGERGQLVIEASDWQDKRARFVLRLVRPEPPPPQVPPADRRRPEIVFDENPLRSRAAQTVVRGQVRDDGEVVGLTRLDPEVRVEVGPDGRFALTTAMPEPAQRRSLGFRARDAAGNTGTASVVLWRLPLCGPADEAATRPQLARIQTHLNTLGYEAGAVDGVLGRNTCEARDEFGEAEDLPPDLPWGELEEALEEAVAELPPAAPPPEPPDETVPPDQIAQPPRPEDPAERPTPPDGIEPPEAVAEPPQPSPPPPQDQPPRRNEPPQIEVASTWTADPDGFIDLRGEASDADGEVVQVEIRDENQTLVAGTQIRQAFSLATCERRVITITAWDDQGLSTSRSVRLSAGHWLGDWVCRVGVAPAWVVGAPAGLAGALLLLLIWRAFRAKPPQAAPTVIGLTVEPDPVGEPLVVEGPRLPLGFRIGEGAPAETRVEVEAPTAEAKELRQ